MAARASQVSHPPHIRGASAANYAALNVRVDGLSEDVSQINTRLNRTATSDEVQRLATEIRALSIPKQPQIAVWDRGRELLDDDREWVLSDRRLSGEGEHRQD